MPFFFKQWGEWAPTGQLGDIDAYSRSHMNCDFLFAGHIAQALPPVEGTVEYIRRVGKKAAGRHLDGTEWNECPIYGSSGQTSSNSSSISSPGAPSAAISESPR